MRVLILLSVLISVEAYAQEKVFAQKRVLDISENADGWVSPRNPALTNDGNYCSYTIHNQPAGSNTLTIKAISNDWKMEIIGVDNATFTDDSHKAIFIKADSLCLLQLGTNQTEMLPGVGFFQLFKQGDTEWLAMQKFDPVFTLLLRNMTTGKTTEFSGVAEFILSPAGSVVLLNKQVKADSGMQSIWSWLSVPDMKMSSIIETTDQLSHFVFDEDGKQVAFLASKISGTYDAVEYGKGIADDIRRPEITKKPLKINIIMRYEPGMSGAELWVDDNTEGIDAGFKINDKNLNFSKDGTRLFFRLAQIPVALKKQEKPVMVEVWNYKDAYLQPEQQAEPFLGQPLPGTPDDYVTVINKDDKKVIRLQKANDYFEFFSTGDEYIIVESYKDSAYNPDNNNRLGKPAYYLISARDGSRKKIPWNYAVSPAGKYMVWFDPEKKHYFSYDLTSGSIKNITARLASPIWQYKDEPGSDVVSFHGTAWLQNDASILIPDQYDIWQVDPSGTKSPVCITNGYGRKHGIILRILNTFGKSTKADVLPLEADLLLFGVKERNKDNGYFRKQLGTSGDPELLTMGPYNYGGHNPNFYGYGTLLRSGQQPPIKAKNADVFIVERENEKEAPDFFLTTDFKNLARLTDIQPHKNINWYTTELVTWKKLDGKMAQGILYKPENFDAKKKYPMIIWYYEKNSPALHSFLRPTASSGDLNIPNFVSNGYLVFVPDITYRLGAPGEGAYNAVVSGAHYLIQRPYVNAKKIGITGHSFGGFETNYLVTRTNLFAAALSANGRTNMTSSYGSLTTSGKDLHDYCENSQPRMGKTLWEDPKAYIDNSPLLKADKVQTPLLIMHTKLDGIVRWTQGVEFFTALRRLNKKVWLLQYDNEPHTIQKRPNQEDFTVRMMQFFDHYLKDAPVPVWMSRGIPARFKGIETGLAPDPHNSCGKDCAVCNKLNKVTSAPSAGKTR